LTKKISILDWILQELALKFPFYRLFHLYNQKMKPMIN